MYSMKYTLLFLNYSYLVILEYRDLWQQNTAKISDLSKLCYFILILWNKPIISFYYFKAYDIR